MDKREVFAAAALIGLVASRQSLTAMAAGESQAENLARDAVTLGAALQAELGKPAGPVSIDGGNMG